MGNEETIMPIVVTASQGGFNVEHNLITLRLRWLEAQADGSPREVTGDELAMNPDTAESLIANLRYQLEGLRMMRERWETRSKLQ